MGFLRNDTSLFFNIMLNLLLADIKIDDVRSHHCEHTKTPCEKRIPGVLWKLVKPVYGLVDAPRGWHLSLNKKFVETGCETNVLDPAMYLYFEEVEGQKEVCRIAVLHIDDVPGFPE